MNDFDDLFAWAEQKDTYWVATTQHEFASHVARELRSQKITQAQFARNVDVKPAYISRVLAGKENLSIKTMVRLANALGCKVNITLSDRKSASSDKDRFFSNEDDTATLNTDLRIAAGRYAGAWAHHRAIAGHFGKLAANEIRSEETYSHSLLAA